jgi:hypothetical protein
VEKNAAAAELFIFKIPFFFGDSCYPVQLFELMWHLKKGGTMSNPMKRLSNLNAEGVNR